LPVPGWIKPGGPARQSQDADPCPVFSDAFLKAIIRGRGEAIITPAART
jgi:hypothetical protein